MRKSLILLYLFLFCTAVFANGGKITEALKSRISSVKPDEKVLVWVFFSDKGLNKETAKMQPENYLGEKSVQRRAKLLDKDALIDITDYPIFPDYVNLLKNYGFLLKQKSKWFNGVSGFLSARMVKLVSSLPYVKQVDLVGKFKLNIGDLSKPAGISNNTLKKDIYSLNYGSSFTQLQQINVPTVHALGYSGKGVTVGVFDAGFSNLAHEVFSKMKILAKWDFVNNGPNVGDAPNLKGEGSHGTATLSAVGGFKDSKLIGPAYEANFILAKTENTESETPVEEDNWIAAMEWADSIGVDVISTSLGYLTFDPPYQSYTWQDMNGHTARITKAAALAARKGIVVVVSAGNEGENSEHNTLGAPADADSIVTVGAVDYLGKKAYFSSIGPTSDGRIKPDVMAMGVSDTLAGSTAPNEYVSGSGTSFSCPLTAGVAALLLSADPKATPVQIRDALRNSGSNKSNPDRFYGWGIIDAKKALDYVLSLATDVSDKKNNIPNSFVLEQNYPNPFNPTTKISYSIPAESFVRLELYNVLGVKISTLFEGSREKGQYSFTLDGSSLASGIYFIRMSAGSFNNTIKIVLAK
ncbi:MAG: S8 family serine peptidase [Bacteroidota bacterium]|nr:S8 family serine peptidase [Bacteroidota bacterium]